MARTHRQLTVALTGKARLPEARALLEEALQVHASHRFPHVDRALAQLAMARVLAGLGAEAPRRVKLAAEAAPVLAANGRGALAREAEALAGTVAAQVRRE